ncbi:hypothetical protein L3X38_034510 [Prunus dulcis]|uniref:RNA helicase n=1 Tax=Prunus dulcis TaxID=3755 RepID=A0AAD4VJ10_PRUDU|nr:hypothetical protein L3X38_034510 [Prunus dulcis]
MEEGTSFLFAGVSFNRKKFAVDFSRFQKKKESEKTIEDLSFLEIAKPEAEQEEEEEEEPVVPVKKRKRKAEVSEPVEGISVFKTSKSAKAAKKEIEKPLNERSEQKKKLNKQLERDSLLRKDHNIHVSGNNIPSPLENFSELSSRYGCRLFQSSYLAGNALLVLQQDLEKTLAFVCPMLMKLKHASKDGIRAVILCPTRELADQTTRECKKMAKGNKFYIKLMTKELARNSDFSKRPCDILISTPLRLRLAIRKKKVDLSRVEYLVLDESDKLFELGLLKQIDSVVKACSNPSIIRSLFSATLPDFVEELARTIMHDAVRVIIGRKNTASKTIKQKLVFAGSEEGKLLALRQSFAESLNPPVLIFVQSKERAKELYGELLFENIRVSAIHSDLSQTQRENAVDDFRAGKTWVLIATDVIARGMDFKGVNCVINYDFPDSAAAYIHRIGRCGRAGRSGEAITFYTEADITYLRNIANVMSASGCEVPSWAMALRKQKWKKHRPGRESISTQPKDEQESTNKKKKKDEQESINKKKRRKMSKNRAIVGGRELSLVHSSKT